MHTRAIVLEKPKALALRALELAAPAKADAVVEMRWSGISTGTERLLWSGEMPPFPGLQYPLVPGYESVGDVVEAGPEAGLAVGDRVFVPGAACYGEVRGLFGGTASHAVVPGARLTKIPEALGAEASLLALAATAHHALKTGSKLPELIVGHGVLGRLMARLALAMGGSPRVWEIDPSRRGAAAYPVIAPEEDDRRDYAAICDVSGDADILDRLFPHLIKGGEVVLAGFYAKRMGFAFPMAFMREARISISAEWGAADMAAVTEMVGTGALSLDGLITHHARPQDAPAAYRTAFEDADCLKMIFDWRTL